MDDRISLKDYLKLKDEQLKTLPDSTAHLVCHLEGFANSLREHWMDEQAVYGSLLIILSSVGYLKLKEEHYIKTEQ